jgi:alpha-D-ribose 1-methylphosphonate 5-triphosphate synthase subunit PhnH
VGIDGGYVRSWEAKQQHFEVIVGKSILAFHREDEEDMPSSKCFGFVQTLDEKPKRRLFEVLKSQGLQMNQQLTFLSDGGDTVRALQLYLSPEAEHLLDWFHLSIRLTVMQQSAKSLPLTIQDEEDTYVLRDAVVRELERLKRLLWHGNVYRALQVVEAVEMDLDVAAAMAMAPHGNSSKPCRSFTRILTATALSSPIMVSGIGTGSASAPVLSSRLSIKSSASASARSSRCNGPNGVRICCCRPE